MFLLLGSNKGDKKKYLDLACLFIQEEQVGTIQKSSSYYKTDPWGMQNASPFLNKVIKIKTKHSPFILLEKLLEIEKKLERKTKSNQAIYQDREIDIDILFYDDLIIQSSILDIPHPKLHLRNFVLRPLFELSPYKIHPILNKSIEKLVAISRDKLKVEQIFF